MIAPSLAGDCGSGPVVLNPESRTVTAPARPSKWGARSPLPDPAAELAVWRRWLDAAWGPHAEELAGKLDAAAAQADALAPLIAYREAAVVSSWEVTHPDPLPVRRRRSRAVRFEGGEAGAPVATVGPAPGATPTIGGRWWSSRAAALRVALERKVALCGTSSLTVTCRPRRPGAPACGPRSVAVTCGQRWLCDTCRRRCYARLRARSARAISAHQRASRAAWVAAGSPRGGERKPVLATLTARHTGDLVADRATIARGWQLLRMWLHKRIGKFVYLLVWETTSGRDGLGHVHAHVVALLPWVSWHDLREEWVRATDSASAGIDLSAGNMKARNAAHYVAKYASKGVDLGLMDPSLAAKLLAMQRGKRLTSSSAGFWLRPSRTAAEPCHKCAGRRCASDFPGSLRAARPVWLTHSGEIRREVELDDWADRRGAVAALVARLRAADALERAAAPSLRPAIAPRRDTQVDIFDTRR